MNREEAMAPLEPNSKTARFPLNAGLFIRASIRRLCLAARCDFYEERGWLESMFIIKGPKENVEKLIQYLKENFDEQLV